MRSGRRASASAPSAPRRTTGRTRSRRIAPRRTPTTRASRTSTSPTRSRPICPAGTSRSTRWRSSSRRPTPEPRRSVRRCRRPRDTNTAHAAVARRVVQRRSTAHAPCSAVHRPVPVAAGSRARRRGRVHARSVGDRVGRADPRRARQADHGRPPDRRAVVRDRDRAGRRVPAGAAGDAPRAGPDPSTQGRAHPHPRRRRERAPRSAPRFRLSPHPTRGVVPRRRQATDAWLPKGQGCDLSPSRCGRRADDTQAAAPHCATPTTTSRPSPSSSRCTFAFTPTRWAGPIRQFVDTSATRARCSPS